MYGAGRYLSVLPNSRKHLIRAHHLAIGARIFEIFLCTPAKMFGQFSTIHETSQKSFTRFLFCFKALGAYQSISIFRLSIFKNHGVEHAIGLFGTASTNINFHCETILT